MRYRVQRRRKRKGLAKLEKHTGVEINKQVRARTPVEGGQSANERLARSVKELHEKIDREVKGHREKKRT